MTRAFQRFAGIVLLLLPLSCDAPPDPLSERISLDVKDASVQSFFQLVADIRKFELEIDPSADRKIRFTCDNITARTALNAVCESVGCRWDLLDGDPRVLRVIFDESEGAAPPEESKLERIHKMGRIHKVDKINQAITLDLVGAPVPEVLSLIAQVLGTELELDEALADASISIQREDASCRELLDQICEDLECDWELIGVDELRPLLLLSKSRTEEHP